MRSAKFIDLDGKLALTLGTYPNWYFPRLEERVYVARRLKAEDFSLFFGRGTYGVQFHGNQAIAHVVSPVSKTYYFDLDDPACWGVRLEVTEIKKPRAGKRQGLRYDWYYQDGRWRQEHEGGRYWDFRGGPAPAGTFACLKARAIVQGATHVVFRSAFGIQFLWAVDGGARINSEALFQWDRQKHWWALLRTSQPTFPDGGLPMGAVPIGTALDVWAERYAEEFEQEAYRVF